MLENCVIPNDMVTVLKPHGMRTLADVSCYCKMTSVVSLDGVTSFFMLERCYIFMLMYATQSNYWRDLFSAMAESLKKLKTSNVFASFIVC